MLRRALHLVSFLLVAGGLLYGGLTARATEAPGESAANAHIALLLPTGADAFVRAAEAVQAGFVDAYKKSTSIMLPVRLYVAGGPPQAVLAAYRDAVAAGARLVVGPLTRDAVTALVSDPALVAVPTLALNVPERLSAIPTRLYMLSLQVEAEARQVAQLALSEGRRRAFTVSDSTALARRMRDAFVEEFRRGGGQLVAEFGPSTDPSSLDRMRQAATAGTADMVFYAVEVQRLRAVRPAMAALTGYGTSQLNPAWTAAPPGGAEVRGVRFVDMPWMVQPDHPAVMIYARRGQREADDLERLYALGIDAFRIAEELMSGKRDIALDGVTGRLVLGPDGQFRRGLLVTLIDGGQVTVLGESRP